MLRPFTVLLTVAIVSSFRLLYASSYTVTEIDVPGSQFDTVPAINNLGQMVGPFGDLSRNQDSGFLYSNGSFTTIIAPDQGSTWLSGINDRGQIIGTSNNSPFLDNQGVFGMIPGWPSQSFFPTGINNQGQIVGYSSVYGAPVTQEYISILDINGQSRVISFPGIASVQALGINNQGQIIGNYYDNSGSHGFLDTNGVLTIISVPGATNTFPTAINDQGVIVGTFYTPDGGAYPFLDNNGNFTTIDVPGHNIIGFTGTSVLNFTLSGINDAGQIVGVYYSPGLHDFLATPTSVPEPSSFFLLGLGAGCLGWTLFRKWKSRALGSTFPLTSDVLPMHSPGGICKHRY